MTLPDRVIGSGGHVADHNQLHGLLRGTPWFNVKDYDAVGNGVANDTAAVQAAIDACNAAGGGTVLFPPGTYLCNAILYAKVRLVGAGAATILKAVAGSNAAVVQGVNFATLEAKGYAAGDYLLGAHDAEICDLTIDGNKATMTTGAGVRIWGRGLRFSNLTVQNCKTVGIHTQFTTHDAGTPGEDPRGFFSNITCNNNAGDGWIFRGPHDSRITAFNTYSNGGWGFFSDNATGTPYWSGSVGGSGWNSWLNGIGSYWFDNTLSDLSDSTASGTTGNGIDIQPGSGSAKLTDIIISGHNLGYVPRGGPHQFRGVIKNCSVGIWLVDSVRNIIDASIEGCATAINTSTPVGGNRVRATVDMASGGTLLGMVPHSTDWFEMQQIGTLGNTTYTWRGGLLEMTGSGTPEGAVTAPVGSTFHRTNGGAGTSLYVKETGAGNTGWVGK